MSDQRGVDDKIPHAEYIENCVRFGGCAVRAGDPGFNNNDVQTSVADALTNILHFAVSEGYDVDSIIEQARGYLDHESETTTEGVSA